jgi:hypothetical protein
MKDDQINMTWKLYSSQVITNNVFYNWISTFSVTWILL